MRAFRRFSAVRASLLVTSCNTTRKFATRDEGARCSFAPTVPQRTVRSECNKLEEDRRLSLQGEREKARCDEVLIAWDGSTSTGGCKEYHRKTQQILDMYPTAKILLWNTSSSIVSREHMNRVNAACTGRGGTQPVLIAKYIEETQFCGKLVIITDGEVNCADVDECDKCLTEGRRFAEVVCFLINTSLTVNMSVTCPFTRHSPHTVMTFTQASELAHPTSVASINPQDLEAFSMLNSINTIEEYEALSDAIERVMVARTMGTFGDPILLDSVLGLKKRLTLSQSLDKGASDSVTSLTAALEAGDTPTALACAQLVMREYYGTMEGEDLTWSGKLSRLVSMCQGALRRGAFDMRSVQSAVAADRIRRAAVVPSGDPLKVPLMDDVVECGAEFCCPTSFEDESSVVLPVTQGGSVLADLDAAIVNDCLNCPLNALKYPEVVQRVAERLDHPIRLSSLQEAVKEAAPMRATSPLTRKLILGALCMDAGEESVAATNWTLAHLFTEGKLSGNVDLWFAVVWFIVKRGEVPHFGRDVSEAAQHHMKYRLKNHKTFISLSGLPELPTTRARLDVAVWFVIASSALSPAAAREPLRAHIGHVDTLRELCDLSGFILPKGIEAYSVRLQCMLAMLSSVKRQGSQLKCCANALVNSVVAVKTSNIRDAVKVGEAQCPEFVPVDGLSAEPAMQRAARALDPVLSRFKAVPDNEVAYLASLVDPSLSAAAVTIPFELNAPPPRPSDNNWRYGLDKSTPKAQLRILPQTCRPQSRFAADRTWRDEAKSLYGFDAAQLLSCTELFGRFVDKYHFYPNRDELLVFVFNRVLSSASMRKSRLPASIEQMIDDTIESFRGVMESVEPREFSKRRSASTCLAKRAAHEALQGESHPLPLLMEEGVALPQNGKSRGQGEE